MTHRDHVALLRKADIKETSVWADFGSGDGAFTLALRDLGGKDIEIYSVDKDNSRLTRQKNLFERHFPQTNIHYLHEDFTSVLSLPLLDGLLMANSLHYVKDHVKFLQTIKKYIKDGGQLIIVEYNTDSGNPWVPYPLSFSTFVNEALQARFQNPELLHTVPSEFLREIYSARAFII